MGILGGGAQPSTSQNTQEPVAATGVSIQSSCYGLPVPILIGTGRVSGNLIEFGGFFSSPNYSYEASGGGGGKGGGGGGGGSWHIQNYNYFCSMAFGLCEGPVRSVPGVWVDQGFYSPTGWQTFPGTFPQAVWSTEAYAGLSYVAVTNGSIGTSPQLPNFNWKVVSVYAGMSLGFPLGNSADAWGRTIKYISDHNVNFQDAYNAGISGGWLSAHTIASDADNADPSIGMTIILTDPYFGAGFPAANLGGLALTTEARTIPGVGPFTLTANKAANYGFNINVVGGPGIPSWFNLQGGTFVVGYQSNYRDDNSNHSNYILSIRDGASTEYVLMASLKGGTADPLATMSANGQTGTPDLSSSTFVAGAYRTMAFTFGYARVASVCLDGEIAFNAAGSGPNPIWSPGQMTSFTLGSHSTAGDDTIRGYLNFLNYFSTPISDTELRSMSQGTSPRTPDYQLNFLTLAAIPSDLTYTRASAKSYTDFAGIVRTVTTGVPVLGLAFWNGTKVGITLDDAATNDLFSSIFVTNWSPSNASMTTFNTLGPDGGNTGARLTASAGAGLHYLIYSGAGRSLSNGQYYGVSYYVKQGTQRYVTVGLGSAGQTFTMTFDFQNAVVSQVTANTVAAPVEVLANGWYRIGFVAQITSSFSGLVAASFGPNATPGASMQSYVAAGTETGFVWGAQGELGGVSPYIATGNSAPVSRAADALYFTSGSPMVCVPSAPTTGQYSVDQSTGIYSFSSSDGTFPVSLRYAARTGLNEMQQWVSAQGLYTTLIYDTQTAASQMVDDLCNSLHVAAVWSGGTLNFVPRGTVTVTGDGFTWVAPSSPLYSLTDDDLVDGSGGTGSQSGQSADDPVIMSRSRPSDQINDIKLEYLDNTNQFAPAIAEAVDQANIDSFGRRPPASFTGHMFSTVTAAHVSVQLMLQDQFIRNVYSFSLDERYCALDPMDIVALTDANNPAVTAQWVQITEITENDDGTLSFIANEYPTGTGATASYSYATGQGYTPNTASAPGPVNAPQVFAAPPALADNQAMEIWVAVSGSVPATWGGASVFISSDDTTYRYLGQQLVPARMGATTSDFPVGNDPDTTNTVNISLGLSAGSLSSGTQVDADQNNTLCLIRGPNGDEFISYQTAALIGTNAYRLGTYIRRGQYQTRIVDHPVASAFVRVDGSQFKIPYLPSDIGKTMYLKFTSFNIHGSGEEQLASVVSYPIVIPAPAPPPNVINFKAAQQGSAVAFQWDAVAYPLVALAGYYIGYAPLGTTDWTMFTMLTEAQGGAGTEMTNADVPPGVWTFAIRAANISNAPGTLNGLSPQMTTADLTVVNASSSVATIEQAPDWEGFMAGFAHDGFAALIPTGTRTVESYAALPPPGSPGLSSVVSGLSLTFTAFVKITYVTAFGETICSVEASQAITSGHAVQVASPPAYAGAIGYNVYVGTTTGTETQQNGTPVSIGTPWTQSIAVFVGAGQPPNNTTGFEPFDDFVPNATPLAYYIPATVDAGLDLQMRIFFGSTELEGPRQAGTPGTGISYGVDAWMAAGVDTDVFVPWTIGSVTGRYVRTMLLYSPVVAGQVQYVTQFLPTIGQVVNEVNSSNVVIAPGGTTVFFGQTYEAIPFVTATVVAGSALFASVVSITTTQCVIHVWNTSGADVGGTVNIQVTGQ